MSAQLDHHAYKFMNRVRQPQEVPPSRWVKHWTDSVDRSMQLQKRVLRAALIENVEIESFQVVCGFAWKTD